VCCYRSGSLQRGTHQTSRDFTAMIVWSRPERVYSNRELNLYGMFHSIRPPKIPRIICWRERSPTCGPYVSPRVVSAVSRFRTEGAVSLCMLGVDQVVCWSTAWQAQQFLRARYARNLRMGLFIASYFLSTLYEIIFSFSFPGNRCHAPSVAAAHRSDSDCTCA
jgi:hypothetical protein